MKVICSLGLDRCGQRSWLMTAGLLLIMFIPATGQLTGSTFTTKQLEPNRGESPLNTRWQILSGTYSGTQLTYFSLKRAPDTQDHRTTTLIQSNYVPYKLVKYELVDENAPFDTLPHRLGVTDSEGRTEWSHYLTVLPDQPKVQLKFLSFPSNGHLVDMELNTHLRESISILIQDLSGVVHYQGIHPPSDRITVRFTDPLKALKPGSYVVILSTRQVILRERLWVAVEL